MLPSSISAPSTLVPMISAVSGSTTEKPKSPRTRPGHGAPGGRAAFSASVEQDQHQRREREDQRPLPAEASRAA